MPVAILFPGQGSQHPGMADAWNAHPSGKEILERSSSIIGWDVVERSRDPEALKRTDVVQLAVFACDLAAFEVLKAEGVRCNVAAGHSLGEYVALVASGAVAVERAEELARTRGAKAVRLPVAGAFHSPLMASAVQPVREALSRIHFNTPAFPIVPNASGKPTTQPLVLRDLLSRHLISPVRWDASMQAMSAMGVDFVVEAGPGDVLGKLARRAIPGATVRSVGTPEQARAVADEIRSRAAVPQTEEAR